MSPSASMISALVRAAGFQQIANGATPGSKQNWLAQHLADTHRREAMAWADRITRGAGLGDEGPDEGAAKH